MGARVQRSTTADVRTVNAELLRADCNRTARGACLPSPLDARGSFYARTANDMRPPITAAGVTIAVAVRIVPFSARLTRTVSDLNSRALIFRTVCPEKDLLYSH
jgi:hypothetical protein